MKDKTILIVDDELELLQMLYTIFEREGYTKILTAASGRAALKVWREKQPDFIILDVMMPDMDGFAVLKEIRKTSSIPVLMLTARQEPEDKFEGFESGADDYLLKPFLPKELLFRVEAILKRAYPKACRRIFLEAAVVDLEKAQVCRHGEIFPLTAKEFCLLEKLWENAGKIVTTGSLCETICGEFWEGYESTLATHIRHLREKLENDPSKPQSLLTARGLGYRLLVRR